jgi:hypothetical protein
LKSLTTAKIWIESRDKDFQGRHLIPDIDELGFENFLDFSERREAMIKGSLTEAFA